MGLGDIGQILRVNQVIDPLGGELRLIVAKQLLASLFKGHIAKV